MTKAAFALPSWRGFRGKGIRKAVEAIWFPGITGAVAVKMLADKGVKCGWRQVYHWVSVVSAQRTAASTEPNNYRAMATNARWGGSGSDPNFETPMDYPDWSSDMEDMLDNNRTTE